MQLETYKTRQENNIAERTLETRLGALSTFEEYIGEGEPDVDDVEDFIEHLIEKHNNGEMKASTIREYYKIIRRYFVVVLNEGGDSLDRIAEWLPDNDSDPGDFLDTNELELFRDSMRGFRDLAIVDVMYFYARRPTEVILLNEEDLDKDEGTITFNILKKNNDNKTVKLELENGDEYDVMRATFELRDRPQKSVNKWLKFKPKVEQTVMLEGKEMTVHPLFTAASGRIGYNSIYKMITQGCDRAGIGKNITPKSLRHSRATHLDWDGRTPGNVARHMLLHDPDSQVIGRYVHERDSDDVREVMTLDGDNNG